MSIFDKLGFDITHISQEVKDLATQAASFTKKLENILSGNLAIDIAAIVPEGEQDREAIIAILETAYKTCQAIQSFDSSGVVSRLQRAGADITRLLHAQEKHTISFYITCFEVVFNDIFGKSA